MMKQIKRVFAVLLFLFMSVLTFGQGTTVIKGTLVDTDGESVAGANIYIKGTIVGAASDFKGNFSLSTKETGAQTLVISFIGMISQEKSVTLSGNEINLGTITMGSDAVGLAEVTVFANIAIDRKTPVPVSNIKPEIIEIKLGMQE